MSGKVVKLRKKERKAIGTHNQIHSSSVMPRQLKEKTRISVPYAQVIIAINNKNNIIRKAFSIVNTQFVILMLEFFLIIPLIRLYNTQPSFQHSCEHYAEIKGCHALSV